MKRNLLFTILALSMSLTIQSQEAEIEKAVTATISGILNESADLYRDLHSNPELSGMEKRTSSIMAARLKSLGFEVTEGVGGYGVVGLFRNGDGPVIMLRTDMDALPVKENTGLGFSSEVIMEDMNGATWPVMHACGHDMHMTQWLGTLTTLTRLKGHWNGTIMAIAQPAEEIGAGASMMISDGLFKRFPVPDYALCYHVSPDLPAGTIGYYPGPIFAGTNSVDIKIFGTGGHGAMPHTTVDPVVLAARTVLAIQTIVSREINPVYPAVITVGSIHGGTKHNIIPGEVDMQLTLRFFEDDVYTQMVKSLQRITRGIAISAGLPEEKMPEVILDDHYLPPVSNNPALTERVASYMSDAVGENNLIRVDPATVAEDFGRYGRTEEQIPVALFWLGSVNPVKYSESIGKGTMLPGLHNESYCPDFEPTFETGVKAMTIAMIKIFNRAE